MYVNCPVCILSYHEADKTTLASFSQMNSTVLEKLVNFTGIGSFLVG